MKHHCGILTGQPIRDAQEMGILVNTPGIPIEWMYAALKLHWKLRPAVRAMIGAADLVELGKSNAASVVSGDGWKMIEAVCPGYHGPVPLWTQLELLNDRRPARVIAEVLGASKSQVYRWRSTPVFCQLTGVRLIAARVGGFGKIGD